MTKDGSEPVWIDMQRQSALGNVEIMKSINDIIDFGSTDRQTDKRKISGL